MYSGLQSSFPQKSWRHNPCSLHFLSVTPSVVTSSVPLQLRKERWWLKLQKGHPLLPSLVAPSCWQHTELLGKATAYSQMSLPHFGIGNKPIPPNSSMGLPWSLCGSAMLWIPLSIYSHFLVENIYRYRILHKNWRSTLNHQISWHTWFLHGGTKKGSFLSRSRC